MRTLTAALLMAFLLVAGVAAADEFRTGTLSGQFRIDAKTPMAEGMVYVYNLATGPAPSHDRYWRVPDFVETLDKEGRFTMDLPPGEYCIGAIKRRGVTQIGPPLEGDFFTLAFDEKKLPKKFSVTKGEKRDIGVITGVQSLQALSLAGGISGVEGTVLDLEGKPVEGAMVFAFMTPNVVGKPLFVSDRSSKEGKFLLRVHAGGTYYLKVRDSYGGGPPRGGAVLDGNKEEPLQKVTVKSGEITRGAVLKGRTFPGRGPNKE